MFEGEIAGRRTSRFEMEPCKLTRPERVEVIEQGAQQSWSVGERSFGDGHHTFFSTESLILAQDERWRRALYMQVERDRDLRVPSRVANG